VESIQMIGLLSLRELKKKPGGSVKGAVPLILLITPGFLPFIIWIKINQIVNVQIWWRCVKGVIWLFRHNRMILIKNFFLAIRFVLGLKSWPRSIKKKKMKGGEKKWLK